MNNFVSVRYVKDNAPSIWKYLCEHECILSKFNETIYKGKMSEGKYLKYLSDEYASSITLECYVNPDSTILLTMDNNIYIDRMKKLGKNVDEVLETPSLYCQAVNMLPLIPMVEGNDVKERIAYVMEDDMGMGDASSGGSMDGGDDANADDSNDGDNQQSQALGQEGAKEDAKNKERGEVKFKIFTAPDKQVTDLKEGEKYLKIEYIYKDKKKGIEIDFLIGRPTNKDDWQLYTGKIGSVSYDDDPYKSLKTKELPEAINNAIDEVLDLIKEVKKDKDDWVQFYIHR